jgi:hypothetical protein
MKNLIASSLAILTTAAALAATPALGEPARMTDLIGRDGKSIDRISMHYDFDGVWVIDNQNLLYRDTSGAYYLVTLKAACKQLNVDRPFHFFPSWASQLLASTSYEVRPQAGPWCDVARIEKVNDARGSELRDAARRRAW